MNKKLLAVGILFLFLFSIVPLNFVPTVLADPAPAGINVLTNHSFEDGLTDWNPVDNGFPWTVKLAGGYDGDKWINSDAMITGSINNISQSFDPPIHALDVIEYGIWVYWLTNAQYPYCKATLGISFVVGEGNDAFEEWNLGLTFGFPHDGWDYLDGYGNISDFGFDKHIDEIWLKLSFGNDGNTEVGFDDYHLDVEVDATIDVVGEPFNDDPGDEPDFVFVDWRYYNFNVTILDTDLMADPIDFLFMQFNITTYEGIVSVAPYWNNQTRDIWSIVSNASDGDINRAGEPVLIKDGSVVDLVNASQFMFSLWFEDKCLDVYDPDDCVDVQIGWNETSGWASGWINYENVFRVYNDGGFPDDTTIVNNAGVLPGGKDLSMFAYNDSSVLKEVVWRDSVHLKFQPTVHFRAGYSDWDHGFALDYALENGVQRSGLQLVLTPDFVSYTGIFAGNVWINMTCAWYNNNSLIKTDTMYMFYHGTVFNVGDAGRWGFWVDLWFDNQNGSQMMGGRVNAYEYPMEDNAAVWIRYLANNWGVKDNVSKQSECFAPIYDTDNVTPISSERIKFVILRSYLNVPGVNASDQFVSATDYGVYDVTLAQQLPMKGINSPPWDETQQPLVGNSGLLGAVFSMFSGIGGWLSENVLFGGLNLWSNFVAFLDTIAGWLGAPGFFTWLFDQVGAGLEYLYDGALFAVDIIAGIFVLLGELLGVFVAVVSDLILSLVNVFTMFSDMMAGGYGAGVNVWDDLGVSTWLTLALIFYPIYLMILWEDKGIGAVMNQLGMIFGLFVGIYELLERVVLGVVTIITSLIESIPVAE